MAAESFGYIFMRSFSSWKQRHCLQGDTGSRSISIAVPLGCVLSSEVMETAGGIEGQEPVLRGEAGAGLGADVPGASHCGALC